MTMLRVLLIVLFVAGSPVVWAAQDQFPPDTTITGATAGSVQERRVSESEPPDRYTQIAQLRPRPSACRLPPDWRRSWRCVHAAKGRRAVRRP
jgi:hypothetical protein